MLEVDKKTFEPEVLQAEGYVLVDFFGFTSLNTTKARRLAIGQKILGLPVIAIYKDGEKVEELVKDDATPEAVEEMIKKYYA